MKLNTEEVDNSNAVWGQSNQMERQLIPAERRLIIEGADPTSIDTETYSKDKIEEALSNIIQSKKSENDFANKNTWGSNSADNFGDIDDDDDPWG